MRTILALLALALALPAAAQTPPAAAPSPYAGMFTSWRGTNSDSLRAEAEARRPAPATPDIAAGAVPAGSPLQPVRSHNDAVALGERVADHVRRGDCAEGERIARQAGDFPLVRAVRDYCRTRG